MTAGTEMIQCKFCHETNEATYTLKTVNDVPVCFGCVYSNGKQLAFEYSENLKGLNRLDSEFRDAGIAIK